MSFRTAAVLHQIEVALNSIGEMVMLLEEEDLKVRPLSDKRSVGELLAHIAEICEADWRIANGATKEEMEEYYSKRGNVDKGSVIKAIEANFTALQERYTIFTEEELAQQITAYWGVTYTRYEWLLEILAHLYHHRGQLHAMILYCCGKECPVRLFD
ncbi:DinB family protein [Bacillus massilinigeriensis]|uniref:DinB family protein n=1 Tax=Bacillus mediterraneensis TaxID=1805474 RepID=UPI0008F901CE|nr:DinB family protein [Bacillus mediterraneensis]